MRAAILEGLLRFIAAAGLIAYIPSMAACFLSRYWGVAAIDTLVYGLIIIAAFAPKLGPDAKLGIIIAASITLGTFLLFALGPDGAGYVWLILSVVFSALLGKNSAVTWTLGATAFSMTAFGAVSLAGWAPIPQSLMSLIVIFTNLALVCLIIVYIMKRLLGGLELALRDEIALTGRLEEELEATRLAKEELARSLAVKEGLLKELDHRVRNNLQLSISLLESGATEECGGETAIRKLRTLAVANELILSSRRRGFVELSELLRAIAGSGPDRRQWSLGESAAAPGRWIRETEALPLSQNLSELLARLEPIAGRAEVSLRIEGGEAWLSFSLNGGESVPAESDLADTTADADFLPCAGWKIEPTGAGLRVRLGGISQD